MQTGFGFTSTAAEVLADLDLGGLRAVVTGGDRGVGLATARALASAGADVVLAVDDLDAGRRAVQSNGRPWAEVRAIDLADLASTRRFASEWQGPLHMLVLGAELRGAPQRKLSHAGWELQLAANYLGHFALSVGLRRALADANGARVVSVSSSAHLLAPVLFDDPRFDFLPYDPWLAYAQSKTACILLAVAAGRRWAADGVQVNACNPGPPDIPLWPCDGDPPQRSKTAEQAAAMSVLLAASPTVTGVTGRYFENGAEAPVVSQRPEDASGGVAPYALNAANAERLWTTALGAIG